VTTTKIGTGMRSHMVPTSSIWSALQLRELTVIAPPTGRERHEAIASFP